MEDSKHTYGSVDKLLIDLSDIGGLNEINCKFIQEPKESSPQEYDLFVLSSTGTTIRLKTGADLQGRRRSIFTIYHWLRKYQQEARVTAIIASHYKGLLEAILNKVPGGNNLLIYTAPVGQKNCFENFLPDEQSFLFSYVIRKNGVVQDKLYVYTSENKSYFMPIQEYFQAKGKEWSCS